MTVVVPSILPSERIVVVPFDRLAKPVILATLVTVPPDCVRLEAVPPVRFAVPAETFTAARVEFAVNVPAVIFDKPVTTDEFKWVVLLERIEVKVPPVA